MLVEIVCLSLLKGKPPVLAHVIHIAAFGMVYVLFAGELGQSFIGFSVVHTLFLTYGKSV